VAKQLFDLPLSASMHAETKQLLAAATELFAESSGDANALLDLALSAAAPAAATPRQRPAAAAGSAAFVAQALLSNIDTVRAALGRLSALSGFLRKSILYGAFAWARRALNHQKRRFPARAGEQGRRALRPALRRERGEEPRGPGPPGAVKRPKRFPL
jgi:hypothetical protein